MGVRISLEPVLTLAQLVERKTVGTQPVLDGHSSLGRWFDSGRSDFDPSTSLKGSNSPVAQLVERKAVSEVFSPRPRP